MHRLSQFQVVRNSGRMTWYKDDPVAGKNKLMKYIFPVKELFYLPVGQMVYQITVFCRYN